MLKKIIDKDNNTKLLVIEFHQKNYQNYEMKSRHIYNNKLEKLKKKKTWKLHEK